jgi:hypothetical protein
LFTFSFTFKNPYIFFNCIKFIASFFAFGIEAEEHGYASILPAPVTFGPIFTQKSSHHLTNSVPQLLGLASPTATLSSLNQERRLIKQSNRKPQGNR